MPSNQDKNRLSIDDVTLLVALERSGTHYLRGVLDSHPAVTTIGEVCNVSQDELLELRESFFGFLREYQTNNRTVVLRREADFTKMIEAYFMHLTSLADCKSAKRLIVDIKCSQLINFELSWWEPLRKPFLLRFAEAHNIRVIFLERMSAFETVISKMYATKTGIWKATNKESISIIPLKVNVVELKAEMTLFRRQNALLREWMIGLRCLHLRYEDIIELDKQDSQSISLLASFLDIEREWPVASPYIKTTPPIAEIVTNYEEIKDLIDWQI